MSFCIKIRQGAEMSDGVRKFILATRNRGKLKEIKEMLADLPFEVLSMEDAGISENIEENGNTFEENALIKARKVCGISGEIAMADDSGLEVDFLGGKPGIFSSRFAGEGASDEERNDKLLRLLEGVPFEKRTARFVCAVAVVFPEGKHFTAKGCCGGFISLSARGENGFGYDPVFYLPEHNMTMAQLNSGEKNRISHRGKALRLMVEELKRQQWVGG